MKGLIAAALGGLSKGVGQVATAQMEINARKALMEAEEEMRARLAEAAESRAEARQIAAEDRAIKNIPRELEATADAEESVLRRRFGEGSDYPGLLSSQMSATETPSQRATREAAEYDLSRRQKQDALVEQLANETDPDKQRQLRDQLTALGSEFKTPEMDPRDRMALENLYSRLNDAEKDYRKALVESGDENILATLRGERDALKREIAGFGGTAAPESSQAFALPEAEIPAAVESAVADLRTARTPEERQQIMDLAKQLGIGEQVISAASTRQPGPEAAPGTAGTETGLTSAPRSTGGLLVRELGLSGVGDWARGVGQRMGEVSSRAETVTQNSMTAATALAVEKAIAEGNEPFAGTEEAREELRRVVASKGLSPENEEIVRRVLSRYER